jgi:hypothetical protein
MASTVTVVLDGEFGERMRAFESASLWIVDSATNLDALQYIRRADPTYRPTTFRDAPGGSGELLAKLLPTVDLHHGEFSQSPPYDRLDVYGARPNHAVQAALASIGFEVQTPTAEGFVAVRSPSA